MQPCLPACLLSLSLLSAKCHAKTLICVTSRQYCNQHNPSHTPWLMRRNFSKQNLISATVVDCWPFERDTDVGSKSSSWYGKKRKKKKTQKTHRGFLQAMQEVVMLVFKGRPVLHTQSSAVAVTILQTQEREQMSQMKTQTQSKAHWPGKKERQRQADPS